MNAPTELDALKKRQQAAWATGNYAVIGTTLQIVGELLVDACDFRYGDYVLDVAAGNGNATLAAARQGCRVTSTDYVNTMLEHGATRARAEGLDVVFCNADAEALPFPDASFDGVVSTFGVMFTPNHAKAALEMLRVCRPGGRIGLANWTPTSLVGRMFRVMARHIPSPPQVPPPALWGTQAYLEELFGSMAASIRVHPRQFNFRYRSPEHFVEVFSRWYGPVRKAFETLGPDAAKTLGRDLRDLLESQNRADEGLRVPSQYLEAVIVRR